MGFGGATSAMITSLKNNKRTRKTSFDKLEDYQKESFSKLSFNKKTNKEDLEKIRLRIKKEQKITFFKNTLLFIFISLLLIYLIGFVIF